MDTAIIKGKYNGNDCTVFLTSQNGKPIAYIDLDDKFSKGKRAMTPESDIVNDLISIYIDKDYRVGNYSIPKDNKIFNALMALEEHVFEEVYSTETSGKAFDIPYYGDDVIY